MYAVLARSRSGVIDDISNFRGGGGGPLGQPPYYVYVVRSKTLLDSIFG
jgi:hypothetical protein